MLTSLKAWLWITQRLDAAHAMKALRQFGSPEQCYYADPAEYDLVMKLPQAVRRRLADKTLDDAERILADCDAAGIGLLTRQDAEYPQRLKNIENPPLVLYYRGNLPRFDEEIAIAMAGTRRSSPYGRKVAGEIAFQITRLGGLVLTGIVEGCDHHTANGALKAGGPVVCVLAGGVDVPYYDTEANRQLLDDVAACGALVSEYPPGAPHLGEHFLQRNRILTGLSVGTVCVEAPAQSGTLQVAQLAADQGRDVYAVPANIDAPGSAGTNQLLARGEALCVCSGADVLEHYWALFPNRRKQAPKLTPEEQEQRLAAPKPITAHRHPGTEPTERSAAASDDAPAAEPTVESLPVMKLSEHAREFTDDEIVVLRALKDEPLIADAVAAKTELPARRISAVLTVLTIRGLIEQLPGGRFRATVDLAD